MQKAANVQGTGETMGETLRGEVDREPAQIGIGERGGTGDQRSQSGAPAFDGTICGKESGIPKVQIMNGKNAATGRGAADEVSLGDLRTISTRICHDLYSPTNTLRMCLTLLSEEPDNEVIGREELLSTANGAIDELVGIVDKLRFVTEASTGRARGEWVDLETCFLHAVEALGTEGRLFVNRIEHPVDWPKVFGVADWIREILAAFLGNVMEHAGPQSQVEVYWERRDSMLRIGVRDDGVGVAEPIRRALFRPFNELHRYNDGRGLSLSIADRLAELQNGRCGYIPLEESGSLFFVELPLTPPLDDERESEE